MPSAPWSKPIPKRSSAERSSQPCSGFCSSVNDAGGISAMPRAGRKEGYKRPLTSDALVRAYRQETDRQKLMIKKAELTQGRLLFVVEAFRLLRDDENFLTLLRAEGLELMPSYLEHSLQARPAA